MIGKFSRIHMITGNVTQNGDPISRTVRAYDRDSGQLIGETVSDVVSGDYYMEIPNCTPISIYVICLDTPISDTNALIYDKVIPNRI